MVYYRYIKHLHQALTELPQILFSDKVQCSLNAVPSIDDCSLLTFLLLSQKSKFESVRHTAAKADAVQLLPSCKYRSGLSVRSSVVLLCAWVAVICQEQLQMSAWANILPYFLEVFPLYMDRDTFIFCIAVKCSDQLP